jgi:hypothetical protein
MSTTTEEIVRQEQEEFEAEQGEPEPPPEDPDGKALFDKSAYETEELALPKIDGEGVDKIAAKFGGTVWLDRGSPEDVALIRGVKVGQSVTLKVEATVGPPVPGFTTNKEGDLDVLYLGRKFVVTGVYRPAAEDL